MQTSTREIAEAVALLRASPDHRVLERFRPTAEYCIPHPGLALHAGVFVDFETTGTDTATAEVIEIGLARFTFDENGVIYTVDAGFSAFEQPSIPIPPEITDITGITDADVVGRRIDDDEVARYLEGVELAVAHHAEFDRKIGERRLPLLERLPWACSQKQIDWRKRGSVGAKLANILFHARGMFYDAHRALDDALVGIDVLCHEQDGRTALAELLETTRTGVYRIYAHGSPFESKDVLKTNGYFWTGDKPWKKDATTLPDAEAEMEWLRTKRLAYGPEIKRISARHRYSVREEARAVFVRQGGPESDPDNFTGGY